MPFWLKIVVNLLAMLAICVGLFLVVALSLDFWTRHGSEIAVPNVKGLPFEEARSILDSQDFEVVLQDSVYEEDVRPGYVVEQNPSDMAVVKPGRTVYLTINAFYPRKIALPTLTDISERQALTTLEGIGFKNVTVHHVPSEYDGLVFSVLVNGQRVAPGTRVPLTARIALEVGTGINYIEPMGDSISTSIEGSTPDAADPEATISTTNASEPEAEPDFFD